jgi:putative ABC transport system permease protein
MFDLVKVAVRNVGRNTRRALITIITVFIGVFVVVGIRGLLDGLQDEIRSGLTRKMHGDIQIHRLGYEDTLETNPYKILIPYSDEMKQILKGTEDVTEVTPRLKVMALLNHQKSQSTTPVIINSFSSQTELQVVPRFKDALLKGKLIDSSLEKEAVTVTDDDLSEAKGLDDEVSDPAKEVASAKTHPKAVGNHQLMVTPSLMRGLNAEIGDEVIVLLQDKDNMQQAIVATLVGAVDFAMPGAAARMAWMDFGTLQKAAGVQGQASEIAIRIKDTADYELVRDHLRAKLDGNLTVQTWIELAGILRDSMNLQNVIFNLVLLIVFSIVISAIVNTSLMTVMERTREIGTLMALGYRRFHITLQFLIESAVIGLIGGLTGMALAIAILFVLNKHGLAFALPGQSIATVLYPTIKVAFLAKVFLLALSSALGASFIPAYRASKMKPVQALTTN